MVLVGLERRRCYEPCWSTTHDTRSSLAVWVQEALAGVINDITIQRNTRAVDKKQPNLMLNT